MKIACDVAVAACYPGGASPKDACSICPAGTFSPGGSTQPCVPCGFGYSSPEGATTEALCVPVNACPAGMKISGDGKARAFNMRDCVCQAGFGAVAGSGICRRCPAGTLSRGGSMDDCQPCGFGHTSEEGADSCRPLPQPCPMGQWAPLDAVSEEECQCYKGFGGERVTCTHTYCPLNPAVTASVTLL